VSPKKESKIPTEKLALYEKLVATHSGGERKGDVHPYTSVNGHMFSYLDQTGTMGLRLPDEEIEGFLKKYKTKLFESYGVVKRITSRCRTACCKIPKHCRDIFG
jgi:hypothetical protein